MVPEVYWKNFQILKSWIRFLHTLPMLPYLDVVDKEDVWKLKKITFKLIEGKGWSYHALYEVHVLVRSHVLE